MSAMSEEKLMIVEKAKHIDALIKAAEKCGIEVYLYVPTMWN